MTATLARILPTLFSLPLATVKISSSQPIPSRKRREGICFRNNLTRGIEPSSDLAKRIHNSRIPVIITDSDSYTVASRIRNDREDQPEDEDKIPLIKKLVQKNIDLNQIVESF